MSKRVADKQLTQDTCEEEDEHVEAGFFQQAAVSDLKERVMKRAKRSLPGNNSASSPFAGFLGLSKGSSPFIISNGKSSSTPLSKPQTEPPLAKSTRDPEYFRNLKALNEQFVSWVKQHMETSSYADFTPVCKDYEKHAKTLDSKYPLKCLETEKAPTNTFQKYCLSAEAPSVPFSFGSKLESTAKLSLAEHVAAVFNKHSPPAKTKTDKENDDNYEPPKNEFTPVTEEGSLYSQRCKLFYKKDGNFVEKGLGVLHLKILNSKAQFLVRADTSLGNILLNIMLTPSIPVNKMGKNNVLMICVPNPPLPKVEPVPTSFLIRVKTSQEADQLISKIQEMT